MITYKGYTGQVVFDPEASIFFGLVIDTQDVITFEGITVDEIRQAFQDSIDDHLDFCQELGKEPTDPFLGNYVSGCTEKVSKSLSSRCQGWQEY